MKDTIDVLELLQSQHDEVDDLIEQIEGGDGDREALFAELADKVAAHATVEEKIFYPSAMSSETTELLHESVEEHLSVKRLLSDMLELDPDEDHETFDAKLAVLKEQITHHARREEEAKLFPLLRRLMSDDERSALGNEVMALYESLIEHQPRQNVPAETTEAAPLPAL